MLDEPVLVLNRSWLPLQVASVRRCIALLYRSHAFVVCPDTYRTFDFDAWRQHTDVFHTEKPCIHSPSFRILLPEVMVLRNFNRTIRRRIRYNRRNIMARDEHTCQYCGKRLPESQLTLEHVLPVSKGGDDTWENVVAACRTCNNGKANRTPQEAGMKLLRPPRRPHQSYITTPVLPKVRPNWAPFLGQPVAATV